MERWLEECETDISEVTEEDIKAASIIHVRTFFGGFLAFLLELHLFAFPPFLSLSSSMKSSFLYLFGFASMIFLCSLNHFHITLF